MICIEIPEKPHSWMPSRIWKGGAYNPRQREKDQARLFLASQYKGELLDVPLVLFFRFCFKPPASATKSEKVQMLDGKIIPTKMDCTNCQKFYEDCLKDIVIKDDRYVCKICSEKVYEETNRVNILIWTMEELGWPKNSSAGCKRSCT